MYFVNTLDVCIKHCSLTFPKLKVLLFCFGAQYVLPFSFVGLSGNKLTLDDLGQVLEEVLDVSAHWYTLGLQLQVRTSTLDSIRLQFQNPRDQLLEMLKTWLTTRDNASWMTLTDALRSRSVGASQLASVLETKWFLMEETIVDCAISMCDTDTPSPPPPPVCVMVPEPGVAETQASKLSLLNTRLLINKKV